MPETLPAKSKPRRRRRDELIRASIRRLRRLDSRLDDARYLPLLRSYCEISLLIEMGYAAIRDGPILSPETNELRSSLDLLRRMMDTQRSLGRELGLSPSLAAALAKPVLDLDQVRDANPE